MLPVVKLVIYLVRRVRAFNVDRTVYASRSRYY